ncbi:hypothetical protein WA1_51755 [Scytonema hofmannii PCC 7110]|jgi:hypothetical protein|uniref:Uncharacterized protein n=1 Tax=Scytonema hofmannii PCC 7110 TaxID=128403 RepID=A0A139WPV1_9CYAN|nr:hypothetical protein [Scytonema hofmannii]KYC34459.1 hypothetical protein WA1_51755 [Scytonema hofmannii PCC 7110]
MSYTSEHWRKAVTKLLELTSNNSIKWEPSQLFVPDAWTIVDNSYMSTIKEKTYVVSETRKRHYLDEDEYVWHGYHVLSIYEKKGYQNYTKLAISPEMSSISSLFDAAQANYAFNSNALGGLLDFD